MNTPIGKWLLAGVVAVSMTMANGRAQAYGDGTAEAVVTGLAIGAVAATLIRDDRGYHQRDTYREVHHYYEQPRRYCPPRYVQVDHYYDDGYYRRGHHHGHHNHGGHRGWGGGRYDRDRTVIVNHF